MKMERFLLKVFFNKCFKNSVKRGEIISEWANESLAKIECMENKEDSD